jgi:hypothetical protein
MRNGCQNVMVCGLLGAACLATAGLAAGPAECPPVPPCEVTYTAGADGAWFTADDAVHHYYRYSCDAQGRVTGLDCMGAGEDGQPFTTDDTRQYRERYTLGAKGQRIWSERFVAPGPDGVWNTADDTRRWCDTTYYAADGTRTRTVRRAGAATVRLVTYSTDEDGCEVRDIEYGAAGADGRWATADDVVEKVHRHRFDGARRRTHSEEMHARHDGRGADGKWLTDDDIVSSTKRYLYDADGRPLRDLKAIAAGADDTWFTDDDVLQYYVRYVDNNMETSN